VTPDVERRQDLLEVLDDRYQKKSTIVTSQLPTTHWHAHLNDATLADAILDRLLHNAIKLELDGDSMRRNQKTLQKGIS
jgi:DNA replication protein DnaC